MEEKKVKLSTVIIFLLLIVIIAGGMYIYSISDKETREFFQDRINKFNEEYFESNNLAILAINTEGEDEVQIEKIYNKKDKLYIDINKIICNF